MTKKEQIIKAIEDMNISMLEVLLDDNKTYQDATKEVFLKKLAEAFDFFQNREEPDSKLIAHSGVCNSNLCTNKGCKGFSFVASKSKYHLDLIFEEDESDDYKDIFRCGDLWSLVSSDEMLSKYYYTIRDDEKANFKPSGDVLLSNVRARKAIEQLRKHSIIEKEIYEQWLAEYEDFYQELDDYLHLDIVERYSQEYLSEMSFREFERLYEAMTMFKQMQGTERLATYVMRNFDLHFKAGTEVHFKKWITEKYPDEPWGVYAELAETFEDETIRAVFEAPQKEFDETLEERTFFVCENLKIDASDFPNLIAFVRLLNKQREEALDKFPNLKNLI